MKNLIIIGASGHGTVLLDCALCMGIYSEIVFADRNADLAEKNILGHKTIQDCGDSRLAETMPIGCWDVIVAVGDNRVRLKEARRFREYGFGLATLIHPAAVVSRFARIEAGTTVLANAVVNACADIGESCIVNTSAVVEHDCVLREGVHISPGAVMGGNVYIGRCSWVCAGAAIGHNIRIGENVVIGAGAAVVSDIEDNSLAVGVPAVARTRVRENTGVSNIREREPVPCVKKHDTGNLPPCVASMLSFLELAAGVLGADVSEISLDTAYQEFAPWDSIAFLRLVMELEDKYGLSVPMEKFGEFLTLGDFYKLVSKD